MLPAQAQMDAFSQGLLSNFNFLTRVLESCSPAVSRQLYRDRLVWPMCKVSMSSLYIICITLIAAYEGE